MFMWKVSVKNEDTKLKKVLYVKADYAESALIKAIAYCKKQLLFDRPQIISMGILFEFSKVIIIDNI